MAQQLKDRCKRDYMSSLLDEINDNLAQIQTRSDIVTKLKERLNSSTFSGARTPQSSYGEYDNFWNSFWENQEYLRTDLPMSQNGKLFSGMSPLEFKEKTIIKLLTDFIRNNNYVKILEIGSGAGLNLLYLAQIHSNCMFYGIEPTDSGVDMSIRFARDIPQEISINKYKVLNNVAFFKGSILDNALVERIKHMEFDLIFTCAALEQVHNNIDAAFSNIFSLKAKHFAFYEEWLDANGDVNHYKTLVDNDYFRIPISFLNKYKNISVTEIKIPSLQPSWMRYAFVVAEKSN